MQYSIVLGSSVLLTSLAAASPLLNQRQRSNCVNPAAVFSSSCWDTLDIPNYLNNWIKTTPTCEDGRSCCIADEPWSTCFLRLAHGVAGADCSEISSNTCSWDPTLAPDLPPAIKPQVTYVMRNIYVINSLFTTLSSGKLPDIEPRSQSYADKF